jgi:hypothetical protein
VLEPTGRHVQLAGATGADFRDGKIRPYRTYFDDISLIEQLVALTKPRGGVPGRRRSGSLDIEFLETQIPREASAAMGLGDEVDLAISWTKARSSRVSAAGPGATVASRPARVGGSEPSTSLARAATPRRR